MSKNKNVKEMFLRCPNCGKLKNANYLPKQKEVEATCFCGTKLIKQLK
jgi:uncharacterized C2H2 Zn-finger protein